MHCSHGINFFILFFTFSLCKLLSIGYNFPPLKLMLFDNLMMIIIITIIVVAS